MALIPPRRFIASTFLCLDAEIPLTANQKPLEFVRNWPELLIRFHVNSNDNPVPELPSVHMMREPSCTKEEEEEVGEWLHAI